MYEPAKLHVEATSFTPPALLYTQQFFIFFLRDIFTTILTMTFMAMGFIAPLYGL